MATRTLKYVQRASFGVIWVDGSRLGTEGGPGFAAELKGILSRCAKDDSLRGIVLASQGAAFIPVNTSKTHRQKRGGKNSSSVLNPEFVGALVELCSLSKPSILRLHGENDIRALALATTCDLVVAALDAVFTPAGPYPDRLIRETECLARIFGNRQLRRYLMTGEPISAAEAYRIGLVDELAPPPELDSKINEILGYLQAVPVSDHQSIKKIPWVRIGRD